VLTAAINTAEIGTKISLFTWSLRPVAGITNQTYLLLCPVAATAFEITNVRIVNDKRL